MPQGGQLFRRKRFHHLPAPLEFIDFADELQDLGRDGDISDLVSADIHLYPFLPNCKPKAMNIYTHLYPFRIESKGYADPDLVWMIVQAVVRAHAHCHSISSGIVRYSKSNAYFCQLDV